MRNSIANSLNVRVPGAFMKLVKGMRSGSGKPYRISSFPLWTVRHPYRSEVFCYFGSDGGCPAHYESWQAFLKSHDDEDPDLNLLVRFDWDEETAQPGRTSQERPCRSQLKLFYIWQRKGRFKSVLVDVKRSDEPDVRRWLKERFEHLRGLWSPVAQEWEEGRK